MSDIANVTSRENEKNITPEMEKAGAEIICHLFEMPLDWWSRDIAREIYVAMRECAPDELEGRRHDLPDSATDKTHGKSSLVL